MPGAHPIEVEQARLQAELPPDATTRVGLAMILGLDADDETEELLVRQLAAAARAVDQYAGTRNVRRAAAWCGFVAGVFFAEAVRRVQAQEAEQPGRQR